MDWHSRPQRSRSNRDSSSDESSNSSSGSLRPYYSNNNSNLSLEELYEEDEFVFNLEGIYSDPSEYALLEEETAHNSAFELLAQTWTKKKKSVIATEEIKFTYEASYERKRTSPKRAKSSQSR